MNGAAGLDFDGETFTVRVNAEKNFGQAAPHCPPDCGSRQRVNAENEGRPLPATDKGAYRIVVTRIDTNRETVRGTGPQQPGRPG